MAIINSYPTVSPTTSDLIIGTDVSTDPISTKTFTVGSIIGLGAAPNIITISKTFTSTEIQTIGDGAGLVALTLVDSPGANKVIVPVSITGFLNFSTTQYNFSQNLQFITKFSACAEIPAATINASSDQYFGVPVFASPFQELKPNMPLRLRSNSATVSTGDSPITFNISYRVVDFS